MQAVHEVVQAVDHLCRGSTNLIEVATNDACPAGRHGWMILRIEKKAETMCDECRAAKKNTCSHAILHEQGKAAIRQLYSDKYKQTMMQELFS